MCVWAGDKPAFSDRELGAKSLDGGAFRSFWMGCSHLGRVGDPRRVWSARTSPVVPSYPRHPFCSTFCHHKCVEIRPLGRCWRSELAGTAAFTSWGLLGVTLVPPLVLHTRGRSPAACLGSLRQQHRGPVGKRVELCACRLLYSPCSPSPAGLRRPITLWRRCPPHSLPFLKILQDCDG